MHGICIYGISGFENLNLILRGFGKKTWAKEEKRVNHGCSQRIELVDDLHVWWLRAKFGPRMSTADQLHPRGIKAGDQMEGSKTQTKILYQIHPQNRNNVTNQWRMDRRYLPKTKTVLIEVGWAVDEGWTADVNHKSNLRLTNRATKWRRIHHGLGPSQSASGTQCTHLFLGRPMVVGSTRFYF